MYRCPNCKSDNYMQAKNPLGPIICLDCKQKDQGKEDWSDVKTWWKKWWVEDEKV